MYVVSFGSIVLHGVLSGSIRLLVILSDSFGFLWVSLCFVEYNGVPLGPVGLYEVVFVSVEFYVWSLEMLRVN